MKLITIWIIVVACVAIPVFGLELVTARKVRFYSDHIHPFVHKRTYRKVIFYGLMLGLFLPLYIWFVWSLLWYVVVLALVAIPLMAFLFLGPEEDKVSS